MWTFLILDVVKDRLHPSTGQTKGRSPVGLEKYSVVKPVEHIEGLRQISLYRIVSKIVNNPIIDNS